MLYVAEAIFQNGILHYFGFVKVDVTFFLRENVFWRLQVCDCLQQMAYKRALIKR